MRQAPRGDVLYGHVVREEGSEPIAFSTQIDGVIGGEIWAPLTVIE